MPKGMIILGSAGAGKTTLGKLVAEKLGIASNNSEQHELWISQLSCPVLRLDGGETLESNAEIIVEEYRKRRK